MDLIGCIRSRMSFSYMGVMVGGSMSKLKSWSDVVQKVIGHLSRWKVKTLSIRGRLTLLKSVLGSIPNYYMVIYKVHAGVLAKL